MFDSLYSKIFVILGSQLGLTWLSTVSLIAILRRQYLSGAPWISGKIDGRRNLGIALSWDAVEAFFWPLLVLEKCVFLILLFRGIHPLSISIPLFIFWSVLIGFLLALALISVDENLGGRVLALTALTTVAAALLGLQPEANYSFLRTWLFRGLCLPLLFSLIRIFCSITHWTQRIGAFFGVALFSLYLVYDTNRAALISSRPGGNTWETAAHLAIKIYLDIIGLFVHLLDLLSKK